MTADPAAARAFILAETAPTRTALVPEIELHLAAEVTPLWQATEASLAQAQLPPPFWAFAWPGGQALARFVLDQPETVRGLRVLDFAAGCGIAAIAAALSGAAAVTASEIDPFALAALALNAARNRIPLEILDRDLLDTPAGSYDLILAGDLCYERPMAERVLGWLREAAGRGLPILLADPGRAYLERDGLAEMATYAIPTSLELEDRTVKPTTVYRLLPTGA